MFELLTGEHLFSGSTAVGVLTKHLTADPDAPVDARAEARHRSARRSICAARRSRRIRASAGRVRTSSPRRSRRSTPRPSATRPGPARVRRSGSAAGACHVTPEDSASDLRLRRSDIDAFERGLKRARYVSLGLVGGDRARGHRRRGRGTRCASRRRSPPSASRTTIRRTRTRSRPASPSPASSASDARRPMATSTSTSCRGRARAASVDHGARDRAAEHRHQPRRSPTATVCTARRADEAQVGDGEVLHRRSIDGPLVITVGETLAKDRQGRSRTSATRTRSRSPRRTSRVRPSRTTTIPTRIRSS